MQGTVIQADKVTVDLCIISHKIVFTIRGVIIMLKSRCTALQCILAYPNPFSSLVQNFVQISEMFG